MLYIRGTKSLQKLTNYVNERPKSINRDSKPVTEMYVDVPVDRVSKNIVSACKYYECLLKD